MKNYWFCDNESGEDFFVMADTLSQAKKIAREYFDEPYLVEAEVEDWRADALGFDTY